jgi:hypothetical protein
MRENDRTTGIVYVEHEQTVIDGNRHESTVRGSEQTMRALLGVSSATSGARHCIQQTVCRVFDHLQIMFVTTEIDVRHGSFQQWLQLAQKQG